MKNRVAAVLAAGAGAALTAGGCGLLPGGELNPLERIAHAVDSTEDVTSYTAEMDFSAMGMELGADVVYSADPEPTMQMDMVTMGQSSTVLVRGSEVLISADGMGMGMGGGPEWLRVDEAEMGQEGAGQDLANQDPLAEVEKLLASKDVEQVGDEEIAGVATTHYRGSYSVDEAVAELDGEEAEAARQVYEQTGVENVEFDLYIDGEGMPRRVTSDAGGQMHSTVDFLSFNEPVDIAYPDEGQIGDFNDLMDFPEAPEFEDELEGLEPPEGLELPEDLDLELDELELDDLPDFEQS